MDLKELANNLRDLREGRGLTLTELEDISKVHRNTINGIETAKHKPRGSTLRKLAKALDADVEALTGAPKGEAPLFSDVPERGPEERCVDYLTGLTDLVEGAETTLREELSRTAGLEPVERAAELHRNFLRFAAPRIGLARGTGGLPREEARALDRLATALDDLRSAVDEGYGFAINALVGRKAEVEELGPRRRGTDEEREATERDTRSA